MGTRVLDLTILEGDTVSNVLNATFIESLSLQLVDAEEGGSATIAVHASNDGGKTFNVLSDSIETDGAFIIIHPFAHSRLRLVASTAVASNIRYVVSAIERKH